MYFITAVHVQINDLRMIQIIYCITILLYQPIEEFNSWANNIGSSKILNAEKCFTPEVYYERTVLPDEACPGRPQ